MKYIDEAIELLPARTLDDKPIAPSQAEERAGKFLWAQASVAGDLTALTSQFISQKSLLDATYGKLIQADTSKNVTEKKISVEANPEYQSSRENLELLENKISYLKTMLKIFENAHVFYRQLAKGDI